MSSINRYHPSVLEARFNKTWTREEAEQLTAKCNLIRQKLQPFPVVFYDFSFLKEQSLKALQSTRERFDSLPATESVVNNDLDKPISLSDAEASSIPSSRTESPSSDSSLSAEERESPISVEDTESTLIQ